MNKTIKYWKIMKFMFKEDFRMQAAMIGRLQFLLFPIFIVFCAFVISISSTILLENMSLSRIYFLLHIIIFLYGLSVGGFAIFGEQIAEERFGGINILLKTPILQPVGFRGILLVFYLKDVILYFLLSIIPIITGIGLSLPLTSFRITSVLFLFLTISLSFMLGISFSFFLSTLYVRLRALFVIIMIAFLSIFIAGPVWGLVEIDILIPSLMFQYTGNLLYLCLALILILFFSFFAVAFLKIQLGRKSERYNSDIIKTRDKFGFTGAHSKYIAKEWLDLKRSGHLFPVLTVYIGPLVFLAIAFWFLRAVLSIPISFNVVFYATMMGLFSVTIFSWLNINDSEFYQVLPVTVPKMIKVKLKLFALIAFTISPIFLIILSLFFMELHLLGLALIVAFITTSYVVVTTAYLTGLRTNTYLFDATILGRFSAMIVPPLIIIIISSLAMPDNFVISISVIGIVCLILILGIVMLYKNIEKRWAKEGFVI
jgi:hypothetical protein